MQNNAKDLIALAGLAFKRQDFQTAGTLFASAMESNDAPEFLSSLMQDNYSLAALSSNLEMISDESALDSLASAAATLSLSMEGSFKESTKAALADTFMDEADFDSLSGSDEDEDEEDDDDDVDFEVADQDEDEDEDEDDFESASSSLDFGNVRSPIKIIG